MKNKYIDLIDQTYYFPQDEFTLEGDELRFHDIDLMELVRRYGAPLKFMYLPKISENIQKAKKWFALSHEFSMIAGLFGVNARISIAKRAAKKQILLRNFTLLKNGVH